VSSPKKPEGPDAEPDALPELPAGEAGAFQAARRSDPASSGSIDVSLSGSIPQAPAVVMDESQPVSRGGPAGTAVAPGEGSGAVERPRRNKRITGMVEDALSGGVEKLGHGLEVVGEGVSKLGDLTNRVPLVGASIGRLGEGIGKAGESIHALPAAAKTRRGRLLVRSVVVGFILVFTWITAIVWFQLRAHDTPDFRPDAERILSQLGKGSASIAQVYEHASPRFHELVKKEVFIDDMNDLFATNGKFREITAINETLVTTGPTGRVGRVGLTASFEHGIAKGSISFHWDKGEWKLLGIGVEVPDNVEISQTDRQKRVAACIDDKGKDVSDQRAKCDVRDAAETILEMIRDGRAGEVWDNADAVFKQQESRARFIQIQEEQRAALGSYKRVLDVTDARAIGGLTAAFDIICEYERTAGVRVELDFKRPSKFQPWQLARFKVTVPMPRPYEQMDGSNAAPTFESPGVDAGIDAASPR